MSQSPRFFFHPWLIVLICAGGFLIWSDRARIQRVEYVSSLVGRTAASDASDSNSPTGYANQQRELIIPERNQSSFDWIAQTQQMFAQGQSRVRYVYYDNTPQGRRVDSASPYRWWLGFVAWVDHLVSGRTIGLSVERAALLADPVLHGLLLLAGAYFVAWRFGGFPAALFSLGMVTLFPFAGEFLPGLPNERGLSHGFVLASLLVLLAGMTAFYPRITRQSARRWFAVSGILGGFGTWISVPTFIPLIAGIFLGALMGAGLVRHLQSEAQKSDENVLPWRAWSLGGGLTVLVAYLAEYFPAQMDFARMDLVHPLYGLAWIGMGELLCFLTRWIQRGSFSRRARDLIVTGLALALISAIPVVMWKTGSRGFLVEELSSLRLTFLPEGATAASFWSWVAHEGGNTSVWATVLPLTILAAIAWWSFQSTAKPEARITMAVLAGPLLVSLGFACERLGWWSSVDCVLLVIVVGAATRHGLIVARARVWLCLGLVGTFAILGITRLLPPKAAGPGTELTTHESQELIERHLAHWLAKRAGENGAVIYAPPHQTTTLCFYGGLRGIGTFAAENRAGFGTTLMIAAMKTMEEAQGLLAAREVRYIVIPSWDPFFEEFAQRYLAKNYSNRTSMLAQELRHFNLPPWLRAVPYQIPVGGGFEGQSVLVFEVVDEQSPATAAGRLAEYLIEVGQMDAAVTAAESLRRFPGDIGALSARIQVQIARGNMAEVAQTLEILLARLASGADRFLPWDRRVSLAVVLARTDRIDLAREQTRRCVSEVNEAKLRSLSTGGLYTLMVLSRSLEIAIADPKLHALALDLLPADLRENL